MKPKLILLPGMMCDHRIYSDVIKEFEPDFEILIADFTTQKTITEMAQSVLGMCSDAFHVLGLSMGGIVAQHVAVMAPERVLSLALLDTNARADRIENAPVRDAQIEQVRNGSLVQVMSEQMIPHYFYDLDGSDENCQICITMALSLGKDAFENQSIALKSRRAVAPELGGIECPTLILYGAQDKLCPAADHDLIQTHIPHAQTHVIDNCGHIPTMEKPKDVNTILSQFYRS